ncbi:MAG: WD40/YVTN/BNR-like repeat-containing protein, partial [Candidatus Neomarinimicrobiota bacterium]
MKKLLLFCGLILWSCQISPTGIEEGEWHLVREPSGDVHFSAIHFADQQHGWAVGDSGTVIHTGDGGDTWEYQQSGA